MKKWIKKGLVAVSVLGLVVGLTACGYSSPEEREARMVKKIASKLDLTEQQKPYLKELVGEFSAMKQQMKAQRQSQLTELKRLINQPAIETSELNTLIDQQTQIMGQHRETMLEKVVALHGVLNPAQKTELVEKLDKIQSHFADD